MQRIHPSDWAAPTPDACRNWDDLTVRTIRFAKTLPWLTSDEKWTKAHLNAFYSYYRRPIHSYGCMKYPRYQSEAEEVFNNMAIEFYKHPEKLRSPSKATFHAIVNQTFKRRMQDRIRQVEGLQAKFDRLCMVLMKVRKLFSRDPVAERRFELMFLKVCEDFRDGIGLEDAYLHGIDDGDRELWIKARIQNQKLKDLAALRKRTDRAISAAICKVGRYLRHRARKAVL